MIGLPLLFSDHMVLRANRENRVFGSATPGARVTVRVGKCTAEAVADGGGAFCVTLPPRGPGENETLTVRCGDETREIRDVAFGEVWLACGQSNMEYPMLCAQRGADDILEPDKPRVRIKYMPRVCREGADPVGWHFLPRDNIERGWERADKESVGRCSAIGYRFAKDLSRALGVPVGLIEMNWGGTVIQSWISEETLRAYPDTLADIQKAQAAEAALGDKAMTTYDEYVESVKATMKLESYSDYLDASIANCEHYRVPDATIRFQPYCAYAEPNRPGCLYRHMVAATAPYAVSGALWYQGESNATESEAERYVTLFGRMLSDWRRAFREPELPFITCQLAPFDPRRWPGSYRWPEMREQQAICAKRYPHVSMAVLSDLGDPKEIHPRRKLPVGDRLCALALEDVYDLPMRAHSPEPTALERTENGWALSFDQAVVLASPPRQLEWVYADGTTKKADATLKWSDQRRLMLSAPEGTPTMLRYAWEYIHEDAIHGGNGMPVGPFRLSLGAKE